MADRSVAVRLKLEVGDFIAGAKQAGSSLEQALSKAGKGEQVANTALGRMEQSMRVQSQAWSTVGGSMLTVGSAAAAIGAAVAKTGIEYNTLQQSSRMALSTMLGGMESANAQMDKLDAFARTSPFAKQTFIKAQQQMLAFGIETKKVIPYLDAVQNAVAAAGGSNADLENIVTIMAKIKSSAKITAMDLNQFGNHGIAAAELIGEAMGKTGAQIRAEITAGTLDADAALDALAEGMATKFDGAAEGLKTTMTGAIDRVKGAWRDLSATMMAPLVDPEGGGLLVSATNAFADFLRMLERMPAPVQQTIGLLGGLTAAAGIVGGGFMLLAPKIRDTAQALKELGVTGADGWLAKMGPGVGAAAKALGQFTVAAAGAGLAAYGLKELSYSIKGIEGADQSIANVANRLKTGAQDASYFSKAFGDLAEGGSLNTKVYGDLGAAITTANRASKSWFSNMDAFAYQSKLGAGGIVEMVDRVKALDAALTEMSFDEATQNFKGIADEALRSGASIEDVKAAFPGFAAAVAEAATAQGISVDAAWEMVLANGRLEVATDDASDAIRESAAAAQAAYEALKRLEAATDAQASANGNLIDAQLKANQAMEDYYSTLEETNGQLVFTKDGQLDVAASSADLVTAIRDVVETRNAELEAMAAAGASQQELSEYTAESERILGEMAAAAGVATGEVDNLGEKLGLVSSMEAIKVDISADTSLADDEIDALIARVIESNGSIIIDANDDPALQTLLKALGVVETSEGMFEIDSNTDPANARFLAQLGVIDTTTGVLKIDANTRAAAEKNRGIKLTIDSTTGYIKIGGADSGALSMAYNLANTINSIRANIKVGTVKVGGAGGNSVMVASGWADGGIVRAYAAGGFENHVAQISAPGITRRWNEPEAGGEAYIPYAIQKRPRSVAITRQVANDFGYDLVKRKAVAFDVGGFYPSMRSGAASLFGGGTTVNVTVNSRDTINNPIAEPDSVKRAKELQLAASLAKGLV